MTKKEEREFVYNKFGGRCAYCGVELQKGWHIDELLPVVRGMKWNKDKTKYVHDGTYGYPERLHIDNQMPSCPSCNINKHSMSLEDFRSLIKGFIVSLNRDSTQYKVAKRYGLLVEIDVNVEFYFERIQNQDVGQVAIIGTGMVPKEIMEVLESRSKRDGLNIVVVSPLEIEEAGYFPAPEQSPLSFSLLPGRTDYDKLGINESGPAFSPKRKKRKGYQK